MKRDTIIASAYAGVIVGVFVDHFIVRQSWPAFAVVVVGLIAIGALHVNAARQKHQTHWPL